MPAQEELKTLCAEPSGSGCDDFAREKPPLRSINRLPLRRMAEKRAFHFLAAPGRSPAGAYGCLQLLQVETIRSERYQNPLRALPEIRFERPNLRGISLAPCCMSVTDFCSVCNIRFVCCFSGCRRERLWSGCERVGRDAIAAFPGRRSFVSRPQQLLLSGLR
jgi:hypothetical protein